MRKIRHILCVVSVWILSVLILSQAVFCEEVVGDAAENAVSEERTIDPGEILSSFFKQVREAVDGITVPDFEGNVHVNALDRMRDAIAEHYRSEDDMSWIQHADLLLQGTANETNGADLEATLSFNDTKLYHLLASFDRAENILYFVCPELKETVVAFPIGDFSADAQTITGRKVTPEMIADYTTLLTELNDLIRTISLEELEREVKKYTEALGGYFRVEKGFTTVTAGSLSEEGNTTTLSIGSTALQEMIPEALRLLSEDELLQKVMKSPFAEHVLRLTIGKKTFGLLPEGSLWQITQQYLTNAAKKDYSKLREFSVTYAVDRNQVPIHLSASMEQSGMKAELFQVNAILDGANHALEVSAGPMLARKAGIRSNQPVGFLVQGSLKDGVLRETVSLKRDGVTTPVLRIQECDLKALSDGWLSGTFTLIWKGIEYSCSFFKDENGMRTMVYSVNGEDWFVLTADLKTVESTKLDEIDSSDSFTVDSRKAFFKYMRDASAIRMFEKLSSAGVPQEYVDMLTDGEAATESSRENTQER